MSKVAAAAGTVLIVLCASAAHASTITIGDIAITTTLVGDAIDMDVTNLPGGDDFGLFGDSGANRAFGFNVIDPDNFVTISNVTPGFSYAGAGVTNMGGGIGDFEFIINGPSSAADASLPLHFTVSRSGGFTSDSALYEPNSKGYVFGAHLHDLDGGDAGFMGVSMNDVGQNTPADPAPVPEPASLLLLGTGLVFTAQRLRNRKG